MRYNILSTDEAK